MSSELVPMSGGIAGEYLARIEGKIDLLNERNSRNSEDIKDARERAHQHSNRLHALEAANNIREGEQRGFDKAIKAIYALATVCGLGSIAAIARILIP